MTATGRAMKSLQDISDGRAVLDIGGDEAPPASGGVAVQSQERVFDRESLKGF